MGYIEDRKVELLKDQESWVRARIGEVMDARAEIDMGFASGEQHPKVVYTGLPVGYADEILKELKLWYSAEPSPHGKVELYIANDDRNNTDFIVANLG